MRSPLDLYPELSKHRRLRTTSPSESLLPVPSPSYLAQRETVV